MPRTLAKWLNVLASRYLYILLGSRAKFKPFCPVKNLPLLTIEFQRAAKSVAIPEDLLAAAMATAVPGPTTPYHDT